jgi:hypothetical protein
MCCQSASQTGKGVDMFEEPRVSHRLALSLCDKLKAGEIGDCDGYLTFDPPAIHKNFMTSGKLVHVINVDN